MEAEGGGKRLLHRRALTDLAVLAVCTLVIFLLLVFTRLHQAVDDLVGLRTLLGLQLDEYLILFIFLGAALAIFSFRRMHELDRQIDVHDSLMTSLGDTEEKFRALAESATDAIISIDAAGHVVFWNQAAAKIFGYARDEIMGQEISMLMTDEYRAMFRDSFLPGARKPAPNASHNLHQYAALHKDGSEFPVEISLSRWESQGERFYTAIVRDITARQATFDVLKESEARFRTLADSATDAVTTIDGSGNLVYWNRAAERIYGFSADEALGRHVSILMPQLFQEQYLREIGAVFSGGSAAPAEGRIEIVSARKDGSEFDAELSFFQWEVRGQEFVTAVARDITEHKAADERLRLSEARYRTLVEAAGDVIFTAELENGTIASLNPAFERVTGHKASDWLGKPFGMLIHPEDMGKAMQAIDRLVAGETPTPYELRTFHESGELLSFELTIGPLFEDGRLSGILGIARDITERKRNDEVMELQRQELKVRSDELEALYRVTATVNQNLKLGDLLNQALYTISRLKILSLERAGGIMLIKGDRMELIAHLGHTEEFLRAHANLTVYDCLCGLAARTGEMVISDDSGTDIRHSIRYEGMKPHGHVIVPLKAVGRVVGVMYFYLPAHARVQERQRNTLGAIGEQLGMAIANAQLYEEAEHMSLHDSLTGLANRNLMQIELRKCLSRAKRSGDPFSLIMLDLDNFKRFNDTYGHTAGDGLLAGAGDIIRSQVREEDTAVRFGGEEFLIILPGTGSAAAAEAAERIRNAVMNTDFSGAGVPPRHITISAGVAEWQKDVLRTDEMIVLADSSLYEAKRRGRNRVFTFETESDRCAWHPGEV